MQLAPRVFPCAMCSAAIDADIATSSQPDAPEMVHLRDDGMWFGMVEGDEGTKLVVVCSPACLEALLSE